MIGGPSIVFSQKAVVDETFIRASSNMCISIIGPDASQVYPFSIVRLCPQDCTGVGSLTLICRSLMLDITNLAFLRIYFLLFYQETRPECKIETFSHLENRRKLILLIWRVIKITVKQCSK